MESNGKAQQDGDHDHHERRQKKRRHQKILQAFLNLASDGIHCKRFSKKQQAKAAFNPNQRIGIIGGGAAGLYAALCLQELKEKKIQKGCKEWENLQYEIIEASNTVGGRIFTKYFNEAEDPFSYSDMGAMRLPTNNAPVFDLIDYVNQKLKNKLSEDDYKKKEMKLITYFLKSVKASFKENLPNETTADLNAKDAFDKIFFQRDKEWHFLNSDLDNIKNLGNKFTPDQLEHMKKVKDVNDRMSAITLDLEKLFVIALQQTVTDCTKNHGCNFRKCMKQSDSEFSKLIKEFGKTTVYYFITGNLVKEKLNREPLTDKEAILYETYYGNSSFLHKNLIDFILDNINFEESIDITDSIFKRGPILKDGRLYQLFTILGGLQDLPERMAEVLPQGVIKRNRKVYRIEDHNGKKVVFYKHTKTKNGQVIHNHKQELEEKLKTKEFDTIIVCLPNPACTNIDWKVSVPFQEQLDAFRVLSSHQLFKIGLYFNKRFWEDKENLIDGYSVIGGQCQTDLPSRWFIYPCYGYEQGPNAPGTLLVYNWDGDALRWTGMNDHDRIDRALDDLQIMYSKFWKGEKPFNIRDYYIAHFTQPWSNNDSTGLAYFDQNQYNTLRHLVQGIDNIYFAAEYLSVHHGWILGAIQAAAQSISKIVGEENFCSFLFPDLDQYKKEGIKIIQYEKDKDPTPLHFENLSYEIDE